MSKMGNEIRESLNEALGCAQGKVELRTARVTITPVCETMSIEEIKAVRETLGMTRVSSVAV